MFNSVFKKNRELISYLIFGGLTTIVSIGVYYICVITFLDPQKELELQIANIIAWICAVIFAYITNKKFVFKTCTSGNDLAFMKFVGTRLSTLFIDIICMALLVSVLGVNDKISKLIVQFIVIVINYVLSKVFVFKTSD